MAFQQNFGASTSDLGFERDDSHKENCTLVSQSSADTDNSNGCFDCNICLDSCHEPVVTLCGHLYCWPCIYKWLRVQSSSFEPDVRPNCPVCKAYISSSSLVPLYGRGKSPSQSKPKKPQPSLTIPNRPQALGMDVLLAASTSISSNTDQQNDPSASHPEHGALPQQEPFRNYASAAPLPTGSLTTTSFFSPTINMVGEMVFAGILRSSDTSLFAYPYSSSYSFPGNASPRLRRQEMQLDKSLNRVSIFLFCCLVLCLILFKFDPSVV